MTTRRKKITVLLSSEEHRHLEVVCDRLGITLSSLVRAEIRRQYEQLQGRPEKS